MSHENEPCATIRPMTNERWTRETVPPAPELAVWKTEDRKADVLCLHGISAQHRSFNALASNLAETPDVIEKVALAALDLRGRGDSEKPESGYGPAAHSDDILRTLDHLGVEKISLCGHSMGAFVAMRFALDHPDRVRAMVLLDGGWPREENPQEASEEDRRAIEEGLARAFSRLDRTFRSPEEYLDFWFPGQNLTPEDLPPDLADYYLDDLAPVEGGGYNPKATREAAEEDSIAFTDEALTADEMRSIECPVALVRAEQGFFPGSDPLFSDEARDVLASALDLRRAVFLPGANHYTMMWQPHVEGWARLLRETSWADE
ncbi:MAG: alpha/beta fold hydrolase [Rubrobacter sp.]